MKEDGLVNNYADYRALPEPVVVGWRLMAEERAAKHERDRRKRERKAAAARGRRTR